MEREPAGVPSLQTTPPAAADAAATEQLKRQLALENRFRSGANWFFWIAGLSIVNSVILLSGSTWSFVVGLGVTRFIDAVVIAVTQDLGSKGITIAVALLLDLFAAGFFVLFGVFARKRHVSAFVIGMVLYGLDALLFVLLEDWLSVAFHAFALWGIFGGLRACRQSAASPLGG